MGLRWYAVPVVSNMALEIGGIRYSAAPFNGWYMGTEIGARNLGDADRYNLLPELARRMGIYEKREASLWRDRALVELNRAVLFSFQKAGVRMVDHHTVADLHLQFEEQEKCAGRPVTGRWDWLVPPLSGSTSPLWNRAYDPTEYSPNFFPQPGIRDCFRDSQSQ
jgi:nitric-oxide synthase